MSKKVVQYKPFPLGGFPIVVGRYTVVCPVDHTSELVSNERPAMTSTVLSYDKTTGRFETLNSIYILVKS